MDIFQCSCGGKCRRNKKLGKPVCKKCRKVNNYVFISYSRKNQDASDGIRDLLLNRGIPFWRDIEEIGTGRPYDKMIPVAISNCSCMVLLLTKDSMDSDRVNDEIIYAIKCKKDIIPLQLEVLLTLCPRTDFNLGSRNIRKIFKISKKDPGMQQFLQEAESYAPPPPPPPSPPSPPPPPPPPPPDVKRLFVIIAVICVMIAAVFGLHLFGEKPPEPTTPATETTAPPGSGETAAPPTTETTGATEPPPPPPTETTGVTEPQPIAHILRADSEDTVHVFGSANYLREQIRSITFLDLDSVENMSQNAWNVSEDDAGSVFVWVEKSGFTYSTGRYQNVQNPTTKKEELREILAPLYNLYIAAPCGVYAPASCRSLFENYSRLKSINFNDCFHVTSTVTDMSNMFYNCTSLKTLDVSHFDTSGVTNMHQMFSGCKKLAELNLDGFKTSNVSNMASMFYDCSSLTMMDLTSFETSNVENMASMFHNCSSLTSLTIASFDNALVTDMSEMFKNCAKLGELDLTHFKTPKVEDMSSMFQDCDSLTNLTIASFDNALVTDMSEMFKNCAKLEGLNLTHFKTPKVEDMSSMFQDCRSLTRLDLRGFKTLGVKNMAFMFCNCCSLTSLDLSSFQTPIVKNMASMFKDCPSLTSLDIRNFNTVSVTDMNSMFRNCQGLKNSILDLRGFDTSWVTDMSYMFYNCDATLDLGDWNTTKVENNHNFMSRREYGGSDWRNLFTK